MRLKSFYGPTLSEAMKAVRDALGDEAIIVATRDDEGGGVRVTAAIDEAGQSALNGDKSQQTDLQAGDAADAASAEVIEKLARRLLANNIPASLAERLLATATQCGADDISLALSAAFDTHLTFQPLGDDKPGPVVLIGPPGAGKTLGTAKLATKARLAGKRTAVISTDTQRAGGMAELAAFTRVLQTELIEIEDSPSLREALLMQAPDTHIFIDTPGCNPFLLDQRERLADLVASIGGAAVLLVPADMDASEASDMVAVFKEMNARALFITRLDLARRLGGLVRVAFDSRLPLSVYSNTDKVTVPPHALNPISLARLFLPDADKESEATPDLANEKRGVA